MAEHKNDYSKEEDYMMWELHEIRKKIAEEGLDLHDLRKRTDVLRTKYSIRQSTLTIKEPGKEYNNRP